MLMVDKSKNGAFDGGCLVALSTSRRGYVVVFTMAKPCCCKARASACTRLKSCVARQRQYQATRKSTPIKRACTERYRHRLALDSQAYAAVSGVKSNTNRLQMVVNDARCPRTCMCQLKVCSCAMASFESVIFGERAKFCVFADFCRKNEYVVFCESVKLCTFNLVVTTEFRRFRHYLVVFTKLLHTREKEKVLEKSP